MKMFERESADNVERPVRANATRSGRGAAYEKTPRVQAHGTQNTVYLKIRLCIYMYLLGL